MAKHNHKWYFVKEVYIDELYKIVWSPNSPEQGNYAKFVCEECGTTKLVLMKSI